jgi:hypothetical protein
LIDSQNAAQLHAHQRDLPHELSASSYHSVDGLTRATFVNVLLCVGVLEFALGLLSGCAKVDEASAVFPEHGLDLLALLIG